MRKFSVHVQSPPPATSCCMLGRTIAVSPLIVKMRYEYEWCIVRWRCHVRAVYYLPAGHVPRAEVVHDELSKDMGNPRSMNGPTMDLLSRNHNPRRPWHNNGVQDMLSGNGALKHP